MPRRLCLRCRKLVESPYWYHYECEEAEVLEFRARMERVVNRTLTEEEIRALFGEQKEGRQR